MSYLRKKGWKRFERKEKCSENTVLRTDLRISKFYGEWKPIKIS